MAHRRGRRGDPLWCTFEVANLEESCRAAKERLGARVMRRCGHRERGRAVIDGTRPVEQLERIANRIVQPPSISVKAVSFAASYSELA